MFVPHVCFYLHYRLFLCRQCVIFKHDRTLTFYSHSLDVSFLICARNNVIELHLTVSEKIKHAVYQKTLDVFKYLYIHIFRQYLDAPCKVDIQASIQCSKLSCMFTALLIFPACTLSGKMDLYAYLAMISYLTYNNGISSSTVMLFLWKEQEHYSIES